MKTAMQELIDNLKAKGGGMEIYLNANTEIINEALEKEKEQIKLSWLDGKYFGNQSNEEDYYNQTYNQERKKEYQPSEKYLKKQKELMEDFIWNKMNKNNQNK